MVRMGGKRTSCCAAYLYGHLWVGGWAGMKSWRQANSCSKCLGRVDPASPLALLPGVQGVQMADLLDSTGKELNPKLETKQVLMEEARYACCHGVGFGRGVLI